MENLKVTAKLISHISVYDDYSPSLDGVLSALWFERRGLYTPNVTRATAQIADIPIARLDFSGEWYFACSSPHYRYCVDGSIRIRKRHDPDFTGHLETGKKAHKWSAQSGEFKSYDLPLFYRSTNQIIWFCVGGKEGIADLLQDCTALGKKGSSGNGFVDSWLVEEMEHDYHLEGPSGQLMKPMPFELLMKADLSRLTDGTRLIETGWRPPARFHRALCACPNANAVREQ